MAVSSTGSTTATGKFAAQIEALLGREKAPLTDLLARRARLATTQGVLTDLGTRLSALRTALDGLQNTGSLSPLSLFKASTGDANMVDATPSSSASRGSHQVTITDLAQNHSLAGSEQTKASTSYSAGDYAFSLTVAGTQTTVHVTVTAGDTDATVLTRVATAINGSGAQVNASVVTTDATLGKQKLVLQSAKSGEANLISSVADTSGGLAASLGIVATSAAGAYSANTVQQAKDAHFNLDGIDLASSSNQVTDALSGVTLNLKGRTTGPVTVSIASDPDSARKVLDDFITKYNDVVSYLRTHTSISTDGKTRAELAGNQTIDTFEFQMRDISGSVISGATTGAPTSLADLGISIARDGTLSVADGTKFSAALNANPAQAIAVFGGTGGLGSQMFKLADSFAGSKGGLSFENSQITDQLGTMDRRQTVLQDRIDRRRAQLVTQFGQLQNLASQLTQLQQQTNGL